MREHARERWESWNSRRVEWDQVFRFSWYNVHLGLLNTTLTAGCTYISDSVIYSMPAQDSGHSRSDAGPSDLGAHEECHSFDQDLHAPSPDLPHCTVGSRQTGQCEHIEADPLEQEPTEDDPSAIIWLPNLQTTQGFIEALRLASLKKWGMQLEDIENLRDPGLVLDLEDPSPLLRSLKHFINNSGSSCAHYKGIREIELLNNLSGLIMSFDQVRCRLSWLSGVMPLEHDMCPNTCVAYTRPYEELDTCSWCSLSCYLPDTNTPHKQFTTVPIGPVIQAFYGSREIARHMHYLERSLSVNSNRVTI